MLLIHPVNSYYANEKIINISNGTDATRIRIKQHVIELYIKIHPIFHGYAPTLHDYIRSTFE